MLKSIIPATGVLLLMAPLVSISATVNSENDDLDLEPCINGGVSSSGLYVSQELEDADNQVVRIRRQCPEEDC